MTTKISNFKHIVTNGVTTTSDSQLCITKYGTDGEIPFLYIRQPTDSSGVNYKLVIDDVPINATEFIYGITLAMPTLWESSDLKFSFITKLVKISSGGGSNTHQPSYNICSVEKRSDRWYFINYAGGSSEITNKVPAYTRIGSNGDGEFNSIINTLTFELSIDNKDAVLYCGDVEIISTSLSENIHIAGNHIGLEIIPPLYVGGEFENYRNFGIMNIYVKACEGYVPTPVPSPTPSPTPTSPPTPPTITATPDVYYYLPIHTEESVVVSEIIPVDTTMWYQIISINGVNSDNGVYGVAKRSGLTKTTKKRKYIIKSDGLLEIPGNLVVGEVDYEVTLHTTLEGLPTLKLLQRTFEFSQSRFHATMNRLDNPIIKDISLLWTTDPNELHPVAAGDIVQGVTLGYEHVLPVGPVGSNQTYTYEGIGQFFDFEMYVNSNILNTGLPWEIYLNVSPTERYKLIREGVGFKGDAPNTQSTDRGFTLVVRYIKQRIV